MHRTQGIEDIPEIVSSADMLKILVRGVCPRQLQHMMKRKSAISLRRQKSFSTQQICAYSKKLDFPLHKTSSVNLVNLSLTLFRKLTRFIDGEESYPVLKDIFVAGIAHPAAFRNEIYAQVMKQATLQLLQGGNAACVGGAGRAYCGVFPPTVTSSSRIWAPSCSKPPRFLRKSARSRATPTTSSSCWPTASGRRREPAVPPPVHARVRGQQGAKADARLVHAAERQRRAWSRSTPCPRPPMSSRRSPPRPCG